nr:hypothetical protein BaRGS_019773 [Batillaria attramentaria]
MDQETRVRIPAEASGIFPTKVGSYPERVCYGLNGEAVATQPRFTHFGHGEEDKVLSKLAMQDYVEQQLTNLHYVASNNNFCDKFIAFIITAVLLVLLPYLHIGVFYMKIWVPDKPPIDRSFFSYYNEEVYTYFIHHFMFTVTEILTTCVVLNLVNAENEFQSWKVALVVSINITHIIVSGMDQFIAHVVQA